MNTEKKILRLIKRKGQFTSAELQEKFAISRAMAHKYLKKFIEDGKIEKINKTRNSYYKKTSKITNNAVYIFKFSVKQDNDENISFQRISELSRLKRIVNKNSYEVANYIITEMINNVLDHSKSVKYKVKLSVDSYKVNCDITDFGIGVFNSIRQKFNLPSDEDAAILLMKGKTTTYSERHTGEGIFFSMKLADSYFVSSGKISLGHYSKENPVMKQVRLIRGTKIYFSLSRSSKKGIREVFDEFAGKEFDYKFGKTKVSMSLGKSVKSLISRSEAKRLMAGAEKFKVVELDFKGINEIGQGFAHEIFGNFKKTHKNIELRIINANNIVKMMIEHVSE